MKKLLCLFTLIVTTWSAPAFCAYPAGGSTQTNYCFVPPYVAQSVKPNIHMILDYSGSMQSPAYLPCSWGGYSSYVALCGSNSTSSFSYKTTKNYYGNFKDDMYYKYNASGYFEENASCSNTDRKGTFSSNCLSGNLLNWITTTRLDVTRRVLTGGRLKSGYTDVLESEGSKYDYTDTNLRCKFTVSAGTALTRQLKVENQSGYTCSIGTTGGSSYSMDVKVSDPSTSITGILQSIYPNQVDLVLSVYNTDVNVVYRVGKNKALTDYTSAINSERAYNGTPTGEAVREAKYYFQQSSSMTATNESTVIGLADYTKDPFYEVGNLPAPCKKPFVLLISDGEWNGSQDPAVHSYAMHKNDVRTETAMQPDKQLVTTYSVYAFGDGVSGQRSMITTAIFGGFEDKDNNGWPYPFTSQPADSKAVTYPRTECNIASSDSYTSTSLAAGSKTFTVATGLSITAGKPVKIVFNDPDTVGTDYNLLMSGTVTSYNSGTGALVVDVTSVSGSGTYATWKVFVENRFDTGCSEWDKKRTGLPFNYFEASDGTTLKREIMGALADILDRASSGTAASMLSNSDSSGALLLQALFFPEKTFSDGSKVRWMGELQAYWYYLDPTLSSSKMTLREDTVNDAKLKMSEDRIAEFFFNGSETKVNLFVDSNGDGAKDSGTPTATEEADDVSAVWRSGRGLWSRLPSVRTVYTNDLNATPNSTNLMTFSTANLSLLQNKLDVASNSTDATNVINYVLGVDPPNVNLGGSEQHADLTGFRPRAVRMDTGSGSFATHAWKLGDIVNSTPKMASASSLNTYNLTPPGGYNDTSYKNFISTLSYVNRGVTFVGANDGMLHAFKLGKNIPGRSGYVSELVDSTDLSGGSVVSATELGKELWAYVPKNALPYLKHLGNPDYGHLYYVDGTPLLLDLSIGLVEKVCNTDPTRSCTAASDCKGVNPTCDLLSPACTGPDCPKTQTSWKTVLLGGMGFGGATRENGATCTDCVKSPLAGIGLSSYFALDVTNPTAPSLMWEFSHPRLGYTTAGPAVVRIKDASDTTAVPKNGKHFVVLASGPTGPVETSIKQMKAFSDQALAIFVLDLKTGNVVRTFSKNCTGLTSCTTVASMPDYAYAGSLTDATTDVDRWNYSNAGYYSDDVVHLGYVRKGVTGDTPVAAIGKFAKGGVLRILTNDSPDPANWTVSRVIDGIGPVTAAIKKLQDKANKKLWLYFGTGRYHYKVGAAIDEDYTGQQEALYGLQEPCYALLGGADTAANYDMLSSCSTPASNIVDQTSSTSDLTLAQSWKINLAAAAGNYKAQRTYTNPSVSSAGVIFFTTFKPSTEVCSYGGDTSIWAVSFNEGKSVTGRGLEGQSVLQLATGELKQIDLASAFTQSINRESATFKGPPPSDEGKFTSTAGRTLSRKILQILER